MSVENVQHLSDEHIGAELDQLSRQHQWCIWIKGSIRFVLLGLDVLEVNNQFYRKHANLLDDEFLINNVQLFVTLPREQHLVFNVGKDWVDIDVPLFEIDIVACSFIIAPIELLHHFNAEYCHNGAIQHLDMLLLLHEQKRPSCNSTKVTLTASTAKMIE